jgi:AbrB family looped-hinge helix DNA binding protein
MATTLSSKGQVVIPQPFREALGLLPGSRIDFEMKGNVLELRLARQSTKLADGCGMLQHAGKALPPDFDPATLLKHDRT